MSVERLSRVRKVIAVRMHESLQGSAQLTSVVEVDLGRAMAAKREHGVSPLATVAAAAVCALREHRALNATIDLAAGTATYHEHVNLGCAVDTEAGLIVPNVKNAQELTAGELGEAIRDLAQRVRNRGLHPEDLEGGTFTITNTGSRGSLLDTPILNAPETGVLAVGKAERRPVVVDETITIRDMAYLCLTYDHRLVDGADAARFLTAVKADLETT